MDKQSIEAFNLPERVSRYDADMAVMHPNRSKMVQIALEVLPFGPEEPLQALDIGVGTGYFTAKFLEAFPLAGVHALDGAEAMLEVARARLGDSRDNVSLHLGDFRELRRQVSNAGSFDVVFSSYALHHLSREEKGAVVEQAASLLRPNGWFVNADIFVAATPGLEQRIQDIRVRGIVERAGGRDDRFRDFETTRRYLDESEAEAGDRPLTLQEDLLVLREAGLEDVAAFWLEYREAVTGGRRP
jgi:ubiquinone/menaquinone biosynthesis C-methylase UbiE